VRSEDASNVALACIGVGAISSSAVTWIVDRLARRFGMMDQPDVRRTHRIATPRLGGIGIVAGLLAGAAAGEATVDRILSSDFFSDRWAQGVVTHPPQSGLLVGAIGFFVLGLVDDLRRTGISPRWKLALQVVLAVGGVWHGLRFDGRVDRAWSAWPTLSFGSDTIHAVMTVLWIVAVVNVVNFMDGIDAILASITIVVFGACGPSDWLPTHFGCSHRYAAAAAGAVLGFAVWNAPRARIFLGDGGSHVLGFLVAAMPCFPWSAYTHRWMLAWDDVQWSMSSPWPLVAAPLVPSIVDVAEALIHKARHGIPMSQAHNDHLYQRLVKAGWSHGAVAIRYGVLALVAVVLVGPVAMRIGAVGASAIGAGVMALHLWTGARTTRDVPRLAKS
jgi:UDP-GlcNAc:undecaprenyl-phosphate GlcNAc-1-phosphate transferase